MSVKKGAEIELNIESAAFEGKGIAKVNGYAVFVPNTTPGDRVKARITKKRKSYAEAKLTRVLDQGPERIETRCHHAAECGGCSWQHVSYNYQLEFKHDQVRDHLHRIGGLTSLKVNDTIGCDEIFHYRNKMDYSIGNRRWLSPEEINSDEFVSDKTFAAGLHAPGRFDKILNLKECYLQAPVSYQILDFVRSWCIENKIEPYDSVNQKGFLRNIMIRNAHYTDDLMVNLVTFKDKSEVIGSLSEALLNTFPAITTIVNNINDRHNPTSVGTYENIIYGPGYITDYIGDYHFNIHANAFFQTNTGQAEKLYKIARNYAGIEPCDTIYDLYCGVGTLSLFLSDKAKQVVGIELAEVAINNARKNARKNEIENVDFVQGDMQEVFNQKITDRYGQPDCLITDPPRAGMHPDVVSRLNELKVPKMVYISCNSSTMARDLKELTKVYEVLEVQPVDMFPQTYHIETVAKLRLKS